MSSDLNLLFEDSHDKTTGMSTTSYPRFEDCPEFLAEEQLVQYEDQGYLAFENALTPEEVKAANADISQIIRKYAFNDKLAEWNLGDDLGTNYSGACFKKKGEDCGFWLEAGYEPKPEDLDELELNVRKLMWFQNETPTFIHLTQRHLKLQGVIRFILGTEPVHYQTMGLIKPPFVGSKKPWHQDNAYFSIEKLNKVCGVWVALDDATAENGCMHVIPGGHKLGPLRHHHTYDCEIMPDRIDLAQAVPIELKAGGALFFSSMLPHETPLNRSSQRRRAVQFHYRSADNKLIPKEKYYSIFKESDGTPATCAYALQKNF